MVGDSRRTIMYRSYSHLSLHEREGIDYARLLIERKASLAVIAPHGGGIEPGTSEIARALAGSEYSFYCFEGLKAGGSEALHIPSTRFDEPLGVSLVQRMRTVIALHGCTGSRERVYVGGLHEELIMACIDSLQHHGFDAVRDKTWHSGRAPSNICNRCSNGRGLQFELTRALRQSMFANLTRAGREITFSPFHDFVKAVGEVTRANNW